MSDPRYTDPPLRDPVDPALRDPMDPRRSQIAAPRGNGGIVAAVIAAILIVGGIIYWSNSGPYNVARNDAPPATGMNAPTPTAPAAPAAAPLPGPAQRQ